MVQKKKHNLNAKGIVREEDVKLLGQGWFRSAWRVDTDMVPEVGEDDDGNDEYEGTWEESVVLKTLRCVF